MTFMTLGFYVHRLRLKQNKYPVLYANFGPSERYDLYDGPLCTGIPVAKWFAKSMGFLVSKYCTAVRLLAVSRSTFEDTLRVP